MPDVAAPGPDMGSAREAEQPAPQCLTSIMVLLVLAWVDRFCNANHCKHASLLVIPGVAVEVDSAAGCERHRRDGSGEGVSSAAAKK